VKVNILEAKNRLSQLIKSAQAGEEVVIANRGEPVARLIAVGPESASASTANGHSILDWLNRNPPPPHRRRTHDEIEAGIREERAAWE
jgi:prevent-host-death family protein